LEEKKGEDIVLLDIQKINAFTDYFIFCSGTSERMLRSLMHAVLDEVKTKHQLSGNVEGGADCGWIAIDLIDIVIHLFSTSQREFYQLEELWNNGRIILKVK
jgi:ribosome-associated protein